MKGEAVDSINVSTTRVDTIGDLKLRVAEYILAQSVYSTNDDVRSILAETKVGAWRRPALLEKLKMVFSLS